jgi:quercetin dioxygenase-like cupin family protein
LYPSFLFISSSVSPSGTICQNHLCLCLLLAIQTSAHEGVQAEILAQSDSSWDGKKLPAYPSEEPQITVLKVVVPPHSELQWHKHSSINAGYLISGEITVIEEGGNTLKLKAGEGLIELVDTLHYGRNDSDIPAEIVVVYVGVKDVPLAIMKDDEN